MRRALTGNGPASGAVIALWLVVLLIMPLRDAFEIGRDEGFEVVKSFQFSGPPEWRAQMWNDQPVGYTWLVTGLFRLFGPDVLVARLAGLAFSCLLLYSLLRLLPEESGWLPRLAVAGALLSYPHTAELSCSGMLEMPALALGMFAIALLPAEARDQTRWVAFVLPGLLFGLACVIKFTAMFAAPWGLARLWMSFSPAMGEPPAAANAKAVLLQRLRAAGFVAAAFGVTLWLWFTLVEGESPVDRLLASHAKSAIYLGRQGGSAHAFPEDEVVSNLWLLPFVLALIIGWRDPALRRAGWPAVIGLVATYLVHLVHRPWWYFYHLHFAIPLAFIGGLGVQAAEKLLQPRGFSADWLPWRRGSVQLLLLAAVLILTAPGARRELDQVLQSSRAKDDPLLVEFKQRAKDARWCFTRLRMTAFRAKVPIIPELAILPYKRFWTGAINEKTIVQTVAKRLPDLLLLTVAGELSEPEWKTLVHEQYWLAYDNGDAAIYVCKKFKSPEPPVRIQSLREELGLPTAGEQ